MKYIYRMLTLMMVLTLGVTQASAALVFEEGCAQPGECQAPQDAQGQPAHQEADPKRSEEVWEPRRDSPYRLDGRAYPVEERREVLVGVLL